jgi:cytochrome c oxidase accessory protein FixG
VTQDKNPADETGKGQDEKEKQYVPSLIEAQAEFAAKRTRPDRTSVTSEPVSKPGTGQRVVTLAEADAATEALYARHKKVYPRQVTGLFADLRFVMVAITLGIFYGLPWINWGAGRQAFLIDLPGRKFNFFFWTFWPQDLFYLSVILILSALLLFFFTAIFGRVWCGFTCPQTVWTEVFLWIERKIDGDRMKQMKLAKMPWNSEKLLKRSAKYSAWILFSLWTGFTFVGFFTPIRELTLSAFAFTLGPWETFWIFFYGFATFGNAGFLREQVCTYMCPYARFQGAMFDKNTLIISYDKVRGEPRGARGRVVDPKAQNLGHCIDCTLCVQVCPTGIDIRNGLQYQCIACAACVDVCDTVMAKMNYPKGLIRYTTENALEGKPSRILRPRVILYGSLLVAIGAALVISVLLRVPLDIDVVRDRNTLYRETAEGLVENVYTLRVLNKDNEAHTYRLSATGIEGMVLHGETENIAIGSGDVRELAVRLEADPARLKERSSKITFHVEATDNPRLRDSEEARFLGPVIR